jgi:hypothetical protein
VNANIQIKIKVMFIIENCVSETTAAEGGLYNNKKQLKPEFSYI